MYIPTYLGGRCAVIDEVEVAIDLSKLLTFITGSREVSPLGFIDKPQIRFKEDTTHSLPHTSTCGPTSYLSLALQDISLFEKKNVIMQFAVELNYQIHEACCGLCNQMLFSFCTWELKCLHE